jgi:hypothetical protein
MPDSNSVVTPVARLSFPVLFKARQVNDDGKPKFSATLLFDKEAQSSKEFKRLEQMVEAAIEAKWGKDRPRKLKTPFLTTEDFDKVPDGYEDDMIIVRTSSTIQPGVVDRHAQPILDEGDIYAGCYIRAAVHAYAWSHKTGGNGVSIGLDHIQFVRDGEAFTKRTKASDVFDALDDSDDDIVF